MPRNPFLTSEMASKLWWSFMVTLLLCDLLEEAQSRSIGGFRGGGSRGGSKGYGGGKRSSSTHSGNPSSSGGTSSSKSRPQIRLVPIRSTTSYSSTRALVGLAVASHIGSRRFHSSRSRNIYHQVPLDPAGDDESGINILQFLGLTSECEAMGFPGATLNECGYCVGESTGLPKEYGKDCLGKCGGTAVVDCNGRCNGTAYIDECTGECVGNEGSSIETNNRDCRGLCVVDDPLYIDDGCGICALNAGESLFLDCSGTCQLPGTINSEEAGRILCNTCIGGQSGKRLSEVMDACGNCIKEGTANCPCNGTDQDACGDCDEKGSSCLLVTEIWPPAVPNKTESTVRIMGAFKGSNQVSCLFVSEDGETSFAFPGVASNTNVTCKVNLPTGKHTVYAKLPNENSTDNGIVLHVYSKKSANVTDMYPRNASYLGGSGKDSFVRLKFETVNLPDVPLICHVMGPDWPYIRKIYGDPDDPYTCLLPYPPRAMHLKIKPTFNKENMLSLRAFPFNFYSPAVRIHTAYASDDGSTVQVIFDRPVDISNLDACESILTEATISALGENLECRWATKHQLSIYLFQALLDESITVGIKEKVLKEDKQRPAQLNEELTHVAIQVPTTGSPMLVITGPTQVPQCGKFALVGHFTSPEGRARSFSWSVAVDEGEVEDDLNNLVQESKSSVLVLEANFMQVGTNYTFTLTTEAEPGNAIQASHSVMKLAYDAPIVTIYSSTLLLVEPVSVDDEVELISEVFVPDCITDVEEVMYIWSVSDPRVKFNMEDLFAPIYVAKSYSLPPESSVTFTLTVFMGSNYSTAQTSQASATISVAPLKMKAKIEGGQEIVLGTNSSIVKLDGSYSMNKQIPLVYQWSCIDEMTQQPCYNYSSRDASNAILITRDIQNKDVLQLNSSSLKPNSELTVGLQVFHANNSNLKSDVETMALRVYEGRKPQVMLKAVYARGEAVNYDIRNDSVVYAVPAGAPIMISAYVLDSEPDTCNIDWKIPGFPYTYNTGKSENELETYLSIDEGILVDHGVYVVHLEACCGRDGSKSSQQCSKLALSLHATPGVLLCQVVAYPYTALNWTHVVVDGCSIPLGRAPLTYQLLFHVKKRLLPIMVPQFSSMLNVIGPPVPSDNKAVFSVEVCDKLDQCRMFNSNVVDVEMAANETESLLQIKRTANQLHASGDSLAALSVLSVAFINQIVETGEEEVNLAIKYAATAIDRQELTPGQVAVMYAAMTFILDKGETEVKRKALIIIEQATQKSKGQNMTLPVRIIQEVYEATSEAFKQSPDDKETAKQVKKTQGMLVEMAASQLPLGQRLELKSEGMARPLTQLHHGFLDRPIVVSSETNLGPVKASVKFGHDLRKWFSKWNCEQENLCHGAVAAVTLYPEHSPFPDDDVNRLTPIVSITLRAPGTGSQVHIKGIDKAVSIELTQISNKTVPDGQIPRCHFWDEGLNKWSLEGMTTLGTSKGLISCYTSHLTSFSVLQIKNGLTAGTIAGIVVAVLMGITIFAVMIVLFVHQKQNSSTHVSSKVVTEPTTR